MAENTKTPPNQDGRPRTSQGDANKPQRPGGPVPGTDSERDRQGVNRPGKPDPGTDPDRGRPDRNRSGAPSKIDLDDLDDDDEGVTPPIDRE